MQRDNVLPTLFTDPHPPRKVKASSSVEMTRQPSYAEKDTDRQTYCCSARDMWRTTDSRRMGWESHAELKRLIWNQQE